MSNAFFLFRTFLFCLGHPKKGASLLKALIVMRCWKPVQIRRKLMSYLSHRNEDMVPKFNAESPRSIYALLDEEKPYGKNFRRS